jgi:dTDP-4-dehydrorhamnose 3,5-epimerase
VQQILGVEAVALSARREIPDQVPHSGNFTATRFAVPGPVLVSARRFGDHRGFFLETYSQRDFAVLGVSDVFVQDNHSLSAVAGTVRGLRGAILDVAVELSAENALQLYVPIGFAHGFCTLQPDTEVAYKVTDTYAPDCDRGIAWNDPDLALPWPFDAAAVQLSDKDRRAPRLRDLPAAFE